MVQTGLHTCGVVVAEAPCAKTKNNTIPKSKAPDFFMLLSYHRFLCAGEDSNLRSPKATGLQPVVIDHSTTDAYLATSCKIPDATAFVMRLPPFLTSKVNSCPPAGVAFLEETSTVMVPPESTPRLTMSEATLVRILSCISRRRGRAP